MNKLIILLLTALLAISINTFAAHKADEVSNSAKSTTAKVTVERTFVPPSRTPKHRKTKKHGDYHSRIPVNLTKKD